VSADLEAVHAADIKTDIPTDSGSYTKAYWPTYNGSLGATILETIRAAVNSAD
jgi:hypothetical protein